MDHIAATVKSGLLADGERPLSAVPVQVHGNTRRAAAGAAGGAIGVLAAKAIDKGGKASSDGLAAVFADRNGLLVLTDQRLVLFAEVPVGHVDVIAASSKLGVKAVEVAFTDGSAIGFDMLAGKGKGDEMAAQLAGLR
jgi:hypothetical protein